MTVLLNQPAFLLAGLVPRDQFVRVETLTIADRGLRERIIVSLMREVAGA